MPVIQNRNIHFLSPKLQLCALLLACGSAVPAMAATLCVNPGGTSGCTSTISAAVAAAAQGDIIQVARGTYKEQVTITKMLSLVAAPGATIDATGQANGIFINGMPMAPYTGVSNVLVSGFTVQNANFEGILVANAADVTLVNNHVLNNDKALDISAPSCNGLPDWETNEAEDCGEGIHLMGSARTHVIHNNVEKNSGGILISDETGPSHNNYISSNRVHDNPFDCGITMASHGPATSVIPSATVSYGVFRNTIEDNISRHNGYQVPGAGAGVGIFAPFPGTTAAQNVVINNQLSENGQPGVAMHNHAAAPSPAPPVNMNGNKIIGNTIFANAADAGDAHTPGTTGINIYSLAPVYGTIIAENTFASESIAVAYNVPQGQLDLHFNNFTTHHIGVDNMGTGQIDASENYWNCAGGPGTTGCVTISGGKVLSIPALDAAFTRGPL
jgi:parallel beta-helix repeat protein